MQLKVVNGRPTAIVMRHVCLYHVDCHMVSKHAH